MTRALPLASLLLSGCGLYTLFEPVLPPLSEELQVVGASDVWSVATDARFPTDVAGLAGGGFGVLDGYQRRALVFDADRAFVNAVPITNDFGAPVRAVRAAEGDSWWFTVPEADGVLRIAPSGEIKASFQLKADDGTVQHGPVAIVDTGDRLVVGLHDGSVVFADRGTGLVSARFTADPDGGALGAITDVTQTASGQLLVSDSFGARVILLDPDGTAVNAFGHFGLWAGWLAKPKAVVEGPDGTVLVADSLLRSVQLFDVDGTFLGVVADGLAPLPLEHPIALEALSDGRYLALDARTAVLWGFTLDLARVETARERAAATRHLRKPLADLDQDAQLASGVLCFHCHDGTIEDDRFVWDPAMGHHPVDVVPLGEVPEFFPLVNGRIACTTCHSPHGMVSESDAATATGEERGALVRHAPTSEDDLFTRVSRTDSALCVSCHTDTAHTGVLEEAGLKGSAHLTGKDLEAALARRGGKAGVGGLPAGVDGGCLTCHAVHGASEDGLRRESGDEILCLACHESKGDTEANHPLRVDFSDSRRVASAGLTLDPIGRSTCRTCHDLVGGRSEFLLARPDTGGTLCATCHEPTRLAGAHINVEGDAGIACLGCHDVHGGPVKDHLLTTLGAATGADPQGCLTCHGPGGVADLGGAQPGRLGHPVVEGEPTCDSCHDAHAPDEVPACGSCHEEQLAADQRGGHGSAECVDCHPAHTDKPYLVTREIPRGHEFNPRDRTCLACHATGAPHDGPKVYAWGHPAPVFTPGGARWTPLAALPLYAEDGTVMPEGQNGDMTCSTCHETHGPDADKPGDHLRRPGWEEVCAACHGDQGLVMYRYFHDPEARGRLLVTP